MKETKDISNNEILREKLHKALHPEEGITNTNNYTTETGEFNFRKFVKILKYLSRTELNRLCVASGMSDREVYAVVSYIYDNQSIAQIVDKLNISVGQFHYKKIRLAHRLRTYLMSINYPKFEYSV